MEFSDAVDVPAPTRFSLAGGFAMAVVLASMMHAPASVFAGTGPFDLVSVDKWIHFGSYAMVGMLIAYATSARTLAVFVAIAVVTICLGIGVELIQSTIPWRTMEAVDVVANTTGTVVGIAMWRIASWRISFPTPRESRH